MQRCLKKRKMFFSIFFVEIVWKKKVFFDIRIFISIKQKVFLLLLISIWFLSDFFPFFFWFHSFIIVIFVYQLVITGTTRFNDDDDRFRQLFLLFFRFFLQLEYWANQFFFLPQIIRRSAVKNIPNISFRSGSIILIVTIGF